jgi:lysozyme
MPFITATRNTVLKIDDRPSMKLAPYEKASIRQGQRLAVVSASKVSINHSKIRFSGKLTIDGKPWTEAVIFTPQDSRQRHWDGLEVFEQQAIVTASRYSPAGDGSFVIPVPYQSQIGNDESIFGPDWRQCFLTSVSGAIRAIYGEAEIAKRVKAAGAGEWETVYARHLSKYGDTTDAGAHVAALKAWGIDARFRTNGTLDNLREILRRGIPVPIGVAWSSSGHWVYAVGFRADGSIIINDPYGKRDLQRLDQYLSIGSGGERNIYTVRDMGRVWLDQGPGTGWLIEIRGTPFEPSIAPKSQPMTVPQSAPKLIQPSAFRLNSIATEMIKSYEGLDLDAYEDGVGVWTIGIGTTTYPNGRPVKPGDRITEQQALDYFRHDVDLFIQALRELVTVSLTGRQIAALTSFIYNVGIGSDRYPEQYPGFKYSTLRTRINEGASVDEIQTQFRRWINRGTPTEAGLRKRRESECELWIGGDWRKHR